MMKKIILLFLIGCVILSVPAMAFAKGQKESEEIVINFPTMWTGNDSKAEPITRIVSEFNTIHEGEIRVVIEEIPDTAMYDRKIATLLAAGKLPEFFSLKWNDDTRALYEKENLLMDFTALLASGELAPNIRKDWIDQVTIDGKVKIIPYEHGIAPIWYNTRLFEKAGIKEFPKTIEDFWVACDKLKAIGVAPTSQMTGSNNAFTTQMWFSHIVNGLGGPDAWSKPFTDPIFIEAANILKRLFLDGNTTKDAIGAKASVPSGHYFSERTAMFINGPWFIGNIRENAPDVYNVTELATFPRVGDYPGSQVGFLLTSFAAAHTDDERQKNAVVEFINYLTRPEIVKELSLAAGSLFTVEFKVEPNEVDRLQQKFIRELENATFIGGRFDTYVSIACLDEFGPGVDDLVAGRITAEEFCQRLEDER